MVTGVNLPGGLFKRDREIDDDTDVPLSDFKGILNKGTQIIGQGSAVGTTNTVHTVTAGKTFFICFLQLEATSTAVAGNYSANIGIDGTAICRLDCNTASQIQQIQLPFPIPLTAKTNVQVLSSSIQYSAIAYVLGYEV